MADPLKKVQRGESILASGIATADGANTVIESANDWLRRKGGRSGPGKLGNGYGDHALEVLVRYQGGALPIFSVLRYSGTVPIDPLTKPYDVSRRPVMDVTIPSAATDAIVITTEPVAQGSPGIVEAVVKGVAVVTVNVTDAAHEYAIPTNGVTGKLKSSEGGPARILYKPSGTGDKTCVVMLGTFAPYVTGDYYTFNPQELDATNTAAPIPQGAWYTIPATITRAPRDVPFLIDAELRMRLTLTVSLWPFSSFVSSYIAARLIQCDRYGVKLVQVSDFGGTDFVPMCHVTAQQCLALVDLGSNSYRGAVTPEPVQTGSGAEGSSTDSVRWRMRINGNSQQIADPYGEANYAYYAFEVYVPEDFTDADYTYSFSGWYVGNIQGGINKNMSGITITVPANLDPPVPLETATITAAGAGSFVQPTGHTNRRVQCWGGGGGGGGGTSATQAGGGGGGGGYSELTQTGLTPGSSTAYVVGAAGAAGADAADAGDGGNTTFDATVVVANGGGGGKTSGTYGNGGGVGTGSTVYAGATGGDATTFRSGGGGGGAAGTTANGTAGDASLDLTGGAGGAGGSVGGGAGGQGQDRAGANGTAGTAPGGGGGGGDASAGADPGFAGGAGKIIITTWA